MWHACTVVSMQHSTWLALRCSDRRQHAVHHECRALQVRAAMPSGWPGSRAPLILSQRARICHGKRLQQHHGCSMWPVMHCTATSSQAQHERPCRGQQCWCKKSPEAHWQCTCINEHQGQKMLAGSCTYSLFARIPAVRVEPLLPPQPTNMTPCKHGDSCWVPQGDAQAEIPWQGWREPRHAKVSSAIKRNSFAMPGAGSQVVGSMRACKQTVCTHKLWDCSLGAQRPSGLLGGHQEGSGAFILLDVC